MKRHGSLNRIYRLIWSEVRNAWIAVAETARGRGKSASRKLLAAVLLSSAALSEAAPTGGQVVSGSGSVASSGGTTTITQASQNLSLNWQSFNIATHETVNFQQPSASAIAVNRIFDTNGTQILGHLNANGQVYLINPNGILFGAGAQVNVGSLVASTLNINDSSLNTNQRTFSGTGSGSVINQGSITAAPGGYVALLGNTVINQGTISAHLGSVVLGAGSAVTITFEGNSLVQMQVDQSVLNSLAQNGALINADGGRVLMSAGAKDALLASVVNNSGVIEARSVENHEGTIVLLGGMNAGTVNVGGKLDASAPTGGNGGFIETSAAHVQVANDASVTTAAAMGLAGTWLIDPVDFTIAATGGDMTGATLSTNLGTGNVQIQSSSGATGTAGNINVNDTVSWSANKLTLTAQNNININSTMNGSGSASLALEYGQGAVAAGNASEAIAHAPVNLPAGNNYSTKLGSNGAIKNYTVITTLGAQGSTTATDLQGMNGNLNANYALGANVDATATSGWNAGAGFAPIGTLANKYTGAFDGLGHTISNLTINRPGTDYIGLFGYADTGSAICNIGLVGGSVSGQDFVGGLVGLLDSGTLSNSYATGNVSGTGDYTGGLVGINYFPISNSYATSAVSGSNYVGGLAGTTYHPSTIGNSYATGSVSGNSSVGGLVGYNYGGTITNSRATGSVSATGDWVGGLVGYNSGPIGNSYATGNVSGTGDYTGGLVGINYFPISNSYATSAVSGSNYVGGLAGTTYHPSTIGNSYATGSVSGNSSVGGLVGYNYGGTITNSRATGSVSATGDWVGGLVGANAAGVYGSSYGGGTISNSYASGGVSGGSNVGGLVGANGDTVSNSFWNTTTSGQAASAGGLGFTTAQIQTQANFTSATAANGNVNPAWDFATTWVMYDGHTAPLLRIFMTPLTVTANNDTKTYNGLAYSGGNGLSYSIAPNGNLLGATGFRGSSQGAINAGSYFIASDAYSNQQGYIITFVNGALTVLAAPAPAPTSVTSTTPPQPVINAITQVQSTVLTSPVGEPPQTLSLSPTLTVAQSASSDTPEGGDTGASTSRNGVVVNTTISIGGGHGPLLNIVNGGMRRPDTKLNEGE